MFKVLGNGRVSRRGRLQEILPCRQTSWRLVRNKDICCYILYTGMREGLYCLAPFQPPANRREPRRSLQYSPLRLPSGHVLLQGCAQPLYTKPITSSGNLLILILSASCGSYCFGERIKHTVCRVLSTLEPS